MTAAVAHTRPPSTAGRRAGERELLADQSEDSEMSGTWVVRMLLAMKEPPAKKATDSELEPIEPGALAAWAREHRRPTGPAAAGAPHNTRVAARRFELNAAVHPRGAGLRWRP